MHWLIVTSSRAGFPDTRELECLQTSAGIIQAGEATRIQLPCFIYRQNCKLYRQFCLAHKEISTGRLQHVFSVLLSKTLSQRNDPLIFFCFGLHGFLLGWMALTPLWTVGTSSQTWFCLNRPGPGHYCVYINTCMCVSTNHKVVNT